ncbi:MAG: zinc ribbon domain-containing protein [Candidatus Thorarchaeota archaeon]
MEKKVGKASQKSVIWRSIVLILYLIIIIFLYYLLTLFKTNLLIIVLTLSFVFLLLLGFLLRTRKSRSLYSKMFPKDKRNKNQQFHQRTEFKIEEEPKTKRLADISLDFKYRKALINRCENCGMTLTSYVRDCPNCGSRIKSKTVVKKCEECGMLIPRNVKKCPICGTPN